MDLIKIGKNIAALRKKKQLTQAQLAEILGISVQAVSKWENGINLPEATFMIQLSGLFKISIDQLLLNDKKPMVDDFIIRNTIIPNYKQLDIIPKISRWNAPQGCDMAYSFPAMLTAALIAAEWYEQRKTEQIGYDVLNDRFCDIMHLTGIGYGFLWRDQGNLIEELWRVNDYNEMISNIMRYYGRDYLWLTKKNATTDEMKKLLTWSIDRGHPVMMEWAGGIPEFSIVTGYEDEGNTVIGWTYCEECATKQAEDDKFINPARWQEDIDFKMLIIGGKIPSTYTECDSIAYALEVLERKELGSEEYLGVTYVGEVAMQKWLKAVETPEGIQRYFKDENMYNYALYMNTIYTQWHILPYLRKLGAKSYKEVDDVVNQIRIAIGNLDSAQKNLSKLNGDEFIRACRQYVESQMTYRQWLHKWLNKIYYLLGAANS